MSRIDSKMQFRKENIPPVASNYSSMRPVEAETDGLGGVYPRFGKRVLDLVLVLLASPMALVIVALAALAIVIEGGRPFYYQTRVGKNGVKFRMFKLRTMVEDADKRLAAYLADHPAEREEWNRNQKLKSDPRVTRVGRFLRKTSIDELPQLFNVLTGDMSAVGPRPMMPDQQKLYPGNAYYLMKPGITGFWQVSERNECEFRDRAVYDARYYGEMSLTTDLIVMIKTLGVVIKGAGY